jgi:hypothetical protein
MMKNLKFLFILIFIFLIISPFTFAQETLAWKKLTTTGEQPSARMGAKMLLAQDGSHLYITCGTLGLTSWVNDTYALDLTTNVWTKLEITGTPPLAGGDGAAVEDRQNQKIYYIDSSANGSTLYGSVKVLDVVQKTWTTLTTTGEAPKAINGIAVLDTSANRIIYFGGSYFEDGTKFENKTYSFDIASNTWAIIDTKNLAPEGRSYPGGIYNSVSNKFIIFGGVTAIGTSTEFWELNLSNNKWNLVVSPSPIVPAARIKCSTHFDKSKNRIILFGGNNDSTYFNTLDFYNFGTSVWANQTPTGDLPLERSATGSAYFIPDQSEQSESYSFLVIFGGDNNRTPLDDTWIIEFGKGVEPPPDKDPIMTILTSQDVYKLGDTLRVLYSLYNDGKPTTVDLLVALQHQNFGLVFLPAGTSDVSYFKQNLYLGTGYSEKNTNVINAQITSPIPNGLYTFYCAIARNGELVGEIDTATFIYE